ncbi:hypothetical protein CcrC1_gp280 [Caulobacter phage C1]|nr:hypothetical protein CcrC1_gp280 [Caulobacter phage C1]UTU08509.1 hypothetical protein CcrC2_gp281 [Caulobacter phage C2]UTU09024.1 hypothetical protein CcrJ4_gp275 [Caulobacter phage J4]UTU10142.1 hypothetical protein CcrRB23_gp280 [Caulobacter phage RB23]WGN97176.1 hypothetical protein [Bertelyvirus sp.]
MTETIVSQDAFVHASTDQRCIRRDHVHGGWAARSASGIEKNFPDYFAACKYAGLTPLAGADKDGRVPTPEVDPRSAQGCALRFENVVPFRGAPVIPEDPLVRTDG